MKTIIIGFGEVGKAHFNVLSEYYGCDIFYKDKGEEIYNCYGEVATDIPAQFDIMLVATQCDPDNMGWFYMMVMEYAAKFTPTIIDILTTTPCGATEHLGEMIDIPVCKSTIRGMHPCLDKFLVDIPKHIGGPRAGVLKKFYEAAGIPCHIHRKSRAPELFHALNNSDYGVAVMKAKENYDLCRHFGVDYMEYLEYKKTNNEGFLRAGYPSKVSPILTPPDTRIGGHCVVYSATTVPTGIRGPLMTLLADFNQKNGAPVKSDKN